ncbi:hypothetical protein ABIA33_007386 [Streptacidiphilus sp. MAP12-16]|uniref:helix-turn-helix domain-containing protein n=1 Tax=Streptacidiphilus sp. MAP12-16 TaxID=3156300 RepID=UPI0035166448
MEPTPHPDHTDDPSPTLAALLGAAPALRRAATTSAAPVLHARGVARTRTRQRAAAPAAPVPPHPPVLQARADPPPHGADHDGRSQSTGSPDVVAHANQLLFTAEQAAILLQIPASWLRKQAAAGHAPCVLLERRLRFARADLDALIAANRRPATARRRLPAAL